MMKAGQAIEYYITRRMTEDPEWQKLEVIFSGAEVEGEGEHKIAQYIRELRDSGENSQNFSHCIYGSDVDLLMLGLSFHIPLFSILREKMVTGPGGAAEAESNFRATDQYEYVHLSVMRQYLALEFLGLLDPPDELLDDLTFLTFLVGNDFLPCLPACAIDLGGLHVLFDAYKRLVLGAGGLSSQHLVDTRLGRLNLPLLSALLREIIPHERRLLLEHYSSADASDKKAESPAPAVPKADAITPPAASSLPVPSFGGKPPATLAPGPASPPAVQLETIELLATARATYYNRHGGPGTDIAGICRAYVWTLEWCLEYYWAPRGKVPCWGHFYPSLAAPLAVDLLALLPQMDPEAPNTVSAPWRVQPQPPFEPFAQLLGVLPPESASLLPPVLANLLCNDDSPLKPFCPSAAKVEPAIPEPGRAPWSLPLRLPFMPHHTLLDTMRPLLVTLPPEVLARNRFGPAHVFRSQPSVSAMPVAAPPSLTALDSRLFAPVTHCRVKSPTPLPVPAFSPSPMLSSKITLPRAPYPQFQPTLGWQAVTPQLGFGRRHPRLLLRIPPAALDRQLDSLSERLLTRDVLFSLPNVTLGRVNSVITPRSTLTSTRKGKPQRSDTGAEQWSKACGLVRQRALTRGFELPEPRLLLTVQPLLRLEPAPTAEPSSVLLRRVYSSTFEYLQFEEVLGMLPDCYPALSEKFPSEKILRLGQALPDLTREPHPLLFLGPGNSFSTCGHSRPASEPSPAILDADLWPRQKSATVNGLMAAGLPGERYIAAPQVADELGVSALTLARITSNLHFGPPANADLGLGFKYATRHLRLPGYARLAPKSPDRWEYSERAVQLLREFRSLFPDLFKGVDQSPQRDDFDPRQVFAAPPVFPPREATPVEKSEADEPVTPSETPAVPAAALPVTPVPWDPMKRVAEVQAWLAKLPTRTLPLLPAEAQTVSLDGMAWVEQHAALHSQSAHEARAKGAQLHTRLPMPQLLLLSASPALLEALLQVAHRGVTHALGDRVANVSHRSLPLGLLGTIVSIIPGEPEHLEVVWDDECLCANTLNGRIRSLRGLAVPVTSILNVSRVQPLKAPQEAKPRPAQPKAPKNLFNLLSDEP